MKITYQQLVKHEACEEARELFKWTFGKEVKITKSICKKYCRVFDYEWVVRYMFPKKLHLKYYKERKPITNKYLQDHNIPYEKYIQNKAMLFYKLSLTLP